MRLLASSTTLLSENAEVSIYEPKVEEEAIWLSLKEGNVDFKRIKTRVTICSSAYEACEDADAIVIVTEWDEFSNKSVDKPQANRSEQWLLCLVPMNLQSTPGRDISR